MSTSAGAARSGQLPRAAAGLSRVRRRAGFAAVLLGLPLVTAVLVEVRDELATASGLLLYLLAVVGVAVLGGVGPAVLAALASFGLANWFLTPPYGSLLVASRDAAVELVVFGLVAVADSLTVEAGARRRAAGVRSALEADLLSRFTRVPAARMLPEDVLTEVRDLFGLTSVALVEEAGGDRRELVRVGLGPDRPAAVRVPAGPALELVGDGPPPPAEDRRLLATLAQAAGRALEGQRLAEEAARVRELEAVDRLRSALLAAVGHELRTPLAGVKVAVSGLRQGDVAWTATERGELLATIEESTDRLAELISNILDLSRLQAGSLPVALEPVHLEEIVATALIGVGGKRRVRDLVADDVPPVLADAGLLERVVANLIDNAVRFSPSGSDVEVIARDDGTAVRLEVADHGPGVPPDRWERMFVPFQRLDDRSPEGLGLGLAIARGFVEAMGADLEPSATPGGGLTMTVVLPVAR
jgi:K+-sensing histidine kinase KdpD